MDYTKIGDGGALLIRDENGNIMYLSGKMPDMIDQVNGTVDKDNYLVIKDNVGNQNWELVAYVPMTVMERDSARNNFV